MFRAAMRFLVLFVIGLLIKSTASPVLAQDRVLLESEKIRAELHDLQQSRLLGAGGNNPELKNKRLQSRLDSIFAAQESLLPATEYQRRPSVKAPEGALELLQHERHAIIDYFFGPHMLHAFVITRKETHYRVIPLPADILARISAFQCQLSLPGADPASYQGQSFFLYQQFLAPLEDLISEIDQLTIIPDAHLRFLPFGALVREEMQKPDYRNLHYVLRDFGVGYALSVSQLAEIQEMSDAEGDGFAVFAENGQAVQVSEDIRRHWTIRPESGVFQIDSDLGKEGPLAEIVHLSLASSKGVAPAEIAHYDLDLELAVLSGIKSKICAIQPNEPSVVDDWLMAMETAGARCIVLPAWKTDADPQSDIWDEFYGALADRQYVDQSLRAAKLDYLEKAADDRIHPHYWAGLLQFNDFAPVREEAHFPWYIFLAGGFLLIVFLGKRL